MKFFSDSFNLLPWREKKLEKKILTRILWHASIIALFAFIIFFANNWFDKEILINRNRLITFKKEFKKLKIINAKQLKYDLQNKKNIRLQKIFKNNKKKSAIIDQLIVDISSSLSPHAFISYFSIEGKTLAVYGISKTKNEVLSLIMHLNKSIYVKTINLKKMKEKLGKHLVDFQIEVILKDYLL